MTTWKAQYDVWDEMDKKFDARIIIEAIKKRPRLYNKNEPNYYSNGESKKVKIGDWKAVCREIYSDFDALNSQKRAERLFEVQRRWKNIRTCFTRDLAQQRQADLLGKQRKRYEYFNELRFLMDQYETQSERDDCITQDNADASSDNVIDDDNNYKEDKLEFINLQAEPVNVTAKSFSIDDQIEFIPRSTEEQLIEIIKEMKRSEQDDDKQFILSLLPSFKRLDDEKKFEAKIEILKVLQKLTYS